MRKTANELYEEKVKEMGYSVKQLEQMETLANNNVYGELKINTDKKRVYLDAGVINIETYVNGLDESYWVVESY